MDDDVLKAQYSPFFNTSTISIHNIFG